MTPPITTYQTVVLVERALTLARLEHKRSTRDQEIAYASHSQAHRRVGLHSLRGVLGRLLIDFGKWVAGRDGLERAHVAAR